MGQPGQRLLTVKEKDSKSIKQVFRVQQPWLSQNTLLAKVHDQAFRIMT